MKCDYVEKFQEFLSQNFGKNCTVCIDNVSDLTQPGENYMSHVLKVDGTAKKLKMKGETKFHFVVKAMRKGINADMIVLPKSMFEKEIAFYSEILPAIENFLIENGSVEKEDIFSECFCYRRNLNGNIGYVDENSILVLQNLHYKGGCH